jgi:small nuclear ribonucleoprotein (snRNP)-like protein
MKTENTNPDNIQIGEECFGYYKLNAFDKASIDFVKGTLLMILPDDYGTSKYLLGIESAYTDRKKQLESVDLITREVIKHKPTKEEVARALKRPIDMIDFSGLSEKVIYLKQDGPLYFKGEIDSFDPFSNVIVACKDEIIKHSTNPEHKTFKESFGIVENVYTYIQDDFILQKAIEGYRIVKI